nr:unnamed protein product [Digitaria exilis]
MRSRNENRRPGRGSPNKPREARAQNRVEPNNRGEKSVSETQSCGHGKPRGFQEIPRRKRKGKSARAETQWRARPIGAGQAIASGGDGKGDGYLATTVGGRAEREAHRGGPEFVGLFNHSQAGGPCVCALGLTARVRTAQQIHVLACGRYCLPQLRREGSGSTRRPQPRLGPFSSAEAASPSRCGSAATGGCPNPELVVAAEHDVTSVAHSSGAFGGAGHEEDDLWRLGSSGHQFFWAHQFRQNAREPAAWAEPTTAAAAVGDARGGAAGDSRMVVSGGADPWVEWVAPRCHQQDYDLDGSFSLHSAREKTGGGMPKPGLDCSANGPKDKYDVSLGQGSLLVLVNAVLSSLVVYHMSSILMPKTVLDILERRRRSFIWTEEETCHGSQCLLAWEHVCQEKEYGGELGHIKTDSYLARIVHEELPLRVGNGKDTAFWHDYWLLSASLADSFPALYSHCTNLEVSVHHALSTTMDTYLQPRLTQCASEEKDAVLACLAPITLCTGPDFRFLMHQPSKCFSPWDVPRA